MQFLEGLSKPFQRLIFPCRSNTNGMTSHGNEMMLILSLILLILVLSGLGWDLAVARLLYAKAQGWVYGGMWPWRVLYKYGELPAYLTAAGAFMVILFGVFHRYAYRYRKTAIYFLLFVLLGPCLVVNFILKDHWGRPRPCQVDIFGGSKQYHRVWEKGTSGDGKSFPCGHAAAGFTLIAPYFLLRRKNPRAANAVLLVGIGYGTLMGIGRMTQGGHYISDVVGAGVVNYLVGLWLSRVMGLHGEEPVPEISGNRYLSIASETS